MTAPDKRRAPASVSASGTEYFAVAVANPDAVSQREDIRFAGLGRRASLYVDRDARLNTGPNGARFDTQTLAERFLDHALPSVRARHGAAVELEIVRRRATTSMAKRWVRDNSWQMRAMLGVPEDASTTAVPEGRTEATTPQQCSPETAGMPK